MFQPVFAFFIGSACLLGAATALAAYPDRPLTLVVPFSVTGSPDIAGTPRISKVVRVMHTLSAPSVTDRLVMQTQQMLASRLAQKVKLERRPGGKTIAGAQQAASAPPDGHTLLLAPNTTMTIYPSLYERLPFDPVQDFVPVAAIARMPIVLVVEKQNATTGIRDLIAHARRFPGIVNFGSNGDNTTAHLAAERFRAATGLKMVHVAYNGGNALVNAVMTGQIHCGFAPLPAVMPFLEGGNIRLLAIASEQRHRALPDVPTFAEARELAGFEAGGWFGLFAPAQTPTAIVSLLNYEINKAFAEPSSLHQLEQQGFEGMRLTPEQFGALVRRDRERWSEVIRVVASGIR